MRTTALCLAALLGLPGVAAAQASVNIQLDLPVVLPRLVVVSPGVQVVPEVREEVFFHDGWYWVRRDESWYRSRNHRGGWVFVPARSLPPRLVGLPPPGHYRNWKAERRAEKEERKAERRAERHHDREERRDDRRDHDRGDRGDHGGHGKGHGGGHGRGDRD
jgi:hypothetical protein